MKKLWPTYFLLFFLAETTAQEVRPFEIRSATIFYEHTGSIKANSVLCFDDYGAKRSLQTTIYRDSAGFEIINRYDDLYIDNHVQTEETENNDSPDGSSENLFTNSIINPVYNSELLKKLGYQEAGQCTILQKPCINYTLMGDTICLWKGLVLKSTLNLSIVSINTEATSIQSGSPPDSVFYLKKSIHNN